MYNSITNAVRGAEGPGDDEVKITITPDHMRKWNKLIAFAKEKGYAGNQELDHNPLLRKTIFDEYNKANPKDAIPINTVRSYQDELLKYKAEALANMKANPGTGDPATFMRWLSKSDNIFGKFTSKQFFPEAYYNGKTQGFAPQGGYEKVKTLMKR